MGVRPLRITFIVVLGLLVIVAGVLLSVSGIFKKAEYLEPWSKKYAAQFGDPRVQLAAHGLLAASGHNMQPWKVTLDPADPKSFELYADSRRMSPAADPPARQMMISEGTFLDYVQVAGLALGYKVNLRLFPQGAYDESKLAESMDAKPVAQITLTPQAPQETPLYDALFLPDTNRGSYLPEPLTQPEIRALEQIGNENVTVRIVQDPEDLAKLGDYAMQGASIEAGKANVAKETKDIFRPNEYSKNRYRYGFSVEGQGTTGIKKHLLQGLVTLFPSLNSGKAAADRLVDSVRTGVEHTPAYALFITPDNSRESQVRSGMAYSCFILQAHRLGLAMQPLSQVLEEYPEMAEPYRAIHKDYASGGGTIQMLVRLGRAEKEAPLSMRRDVSELLADTSAAR